MIGKFMCKFKCLNPSKKEILHTSSMLGATTYIFFLKKEMEITFSEKNYVLVNLNIYVMGIKAKNFSKQK